MLYVRHLGFKGNFEKKLAERDAKALELLDLVEEVKAEAKQFMKVRAVWQFFEADSAGNTLRVYDTVATRPAAEFTFPRQRRTDGLSLADFVVPPVNGTRDSFAAFVVRSGRLHSPTRRAVQAAGRAVEVARNSRRSLSRPRRLAPNGCTGVSAKTGASLTRPKQQCSTASRRSTADGVTVSVILPAQSWKINTACLICCTQKTSASS